MRKRYKRPAAAGGRRRVSGKVILISGTAALLAAGTGISLAATQGSSSNSVTCIVLADAKAAADANSALSDHFPVGTALHLTSAGRQVDVAVSGPITAAAPTTAAPAPTDTATAQPTASATTDPPASGQPTATATGQPTATATSGAPAGGKKHRHHHRPPRSGQTTKPAAKPTTGASATESDAQKVAKVAKVSVKADDNGGVDANSVCVELSKNAFNTLGGVADGNNVGAFIATMTPVQGGAAGNGGGQASNGGAQNGGGQAGNNGGGQAGNGGAQAGNGGQNNGGAGASPSASASAGNGQNAGGGNTKGGTGHHHKQNNG